MKQTRSTTPRMKQYVRRATLIVAATVMAFSLPGHVFADTFDEQISQIQNEINGYQAEAGRLRSHADTLQNAVNVLTAQKKAIQAQVNLSQARYDKLVAEIKASEKKLASQQGVLASTISDLSQETTTSPIELLAGSSSIGDFIDRQEYRSSVQEQIQSSIKEIKELKIKLDKQKKEAEIVLTDQKKQRDLLAAKQAEQANLLAQTRGQEAQYQGLIAEKNSQVGALRAKQAAAMAAAGAGDGLAYGTSSYPWNNKSMNYNDNCVYPNGTVGADIWGYCYRQCVSYVAWKLANDGRGNSGFAGLSHAQYWGSGGRGVAVNEARAGDVIVWYIGDYGHVMYVEWVSGGSVGISQMNVPYDSGAYSTKTYSMGELSNGAYDIRRFH